MRANNCFFNMAVIEWCKLFADKKGKHHWRVIFEKDEFLDPLLTHFSLSKNKYIYKLKEIKNYRNKYVAHLDTPVEMTYPYTRIMLTSAIFLYDTLNNSEHTKKHLLGSQGEKYPSAQDYYYIQYGQYEQEIIIRFKNQ